MTRPAHRRAKYAFSVRYGPGQVGWFYIYEVGIVRRKLRSEMDLSRVPEDRRNEAERDLLRQAKVVLKKRPVEITLVHLG